MDLCAEAKRLPCRPGHVCIFSRLGLALQTGDVSCAVGAAQSRLQGGIQVECTMTSHRLASRWQRSGPAGAQLSKHMQHSADLCMSWWHHAQGLVSYSKSILDLAIYKTSKPC